MKKAKLFVLIFSILLCAAMCIALSACGKKSDTVGISDDGLVWVKGDDGIHITGYSGIKADLTIPATIQKTPVVAIEGYVFENNDTLKNVTIPDSVTSIGKSAFLGCSSLTGVYISDIEAWCNISFSNGGSNPLSYAKNLYLNGTLITELTIPDSIISIKSSTFHGCSSLTSITIPIGVETIGNYAFYKCSALTTVTFAENSQLSSIGESAFLGCSSLTSITIPDTVTSIDSSTFYGCSNLTSVTIPDSVTSIDDYAFCDCSSLTSITIPDSVTSIGEYAFYDCSNLTSIKYTGTEEEWNAITKHFNWDYNTGRYSITYNYDGN